VDAKGILLDIDNTLYDYEKTHKIALDTVCNVLEKKYSLGREAVGESYRKARLEIHTELEDTASSHNRLLYFQRMFEYWNMNALRYSLEAYNLYWDTFLANLAAYDGVYDFLKFIKNKKVCLVSDLSADIQHRKIEKMKLFDYVGFLVTSEEAGKEKPHPHIFMLALKKLGLKTPEVYMIGDSYENDIMGATGLGIKSFWLNKNDEEKPKNALVTKVKNFSELIEHLK
jgi:putative hydrolase of the HAD superfamily